MGRGWASKTQTPSDLAHRSLSASTPDRTDQGSLPRPPPDAPGGGHSYIIAMGARLFRRSVRINLARFQAHENCIRIFLARFLAPMISSRLPTALIGPSFTHVEMEIQS